MLYNGKSRSLLIPWSSANLLLRQLDCQKRGGHTLAHQSRRIISIMPRGIVVTKDEGGEPLEVLELVDNLEKPRASPGFVVVHLTIRPLNPADFINVRNGGRFHGKRMPKGTVVGGEGFGIVEEVGEGVSKVKVGQRVVPVLRNYQTSSQWEVPGSFQEYVQVPEGNVYPVPDAVSDEIAAQFVINPWTAYGLIEELQVRNGEYILQTAAGSVLGREVIQLAKYYGFKTINVVRRAELKEELKAIGADEVIDSTTEDVVARVQEITAGKGAYAAVDAIAGEMTKISEYKAAPMQTVAASVRNGGTILIYGMLSSIEVRLNVADLMRKVELKMFALRDYVALHEKGDQVAALVLRLIEQKVIEPYTGKKFALEDFKAALVEAEKNARGGKVLLVNS